MMMMMMMMMMNCFCGMVDWRKAISLISSRDHCQRSSPSRISDTPRAGFLTITNLRHAASRVWICVEPEFRLEVENEVLSSEWSCAVVITTTPRRHITTTPRWHVKEDTTWRHVDTRRERVKTPYKLKGKMQFTKNNIFNLKHFWKSLHLGGF